ncbi:MAG TPA: hypothetical protein ENK05_03820 [Gammaproteobacteria bacterium]|nr:hypothetical protein [Gammaproteobacteria bacterium]
MRWDIRRTGTLVLLILLPACSWLRSGVSPEEVRLATADEVRACSERGTVDVSVYDRPSELKRGEAALAGELLSLARQSAVQLGGDTLVPHGAIVDGSRVYGVYRCRR